MSHTSARQQRRHTQRAARHSAMPPRFMPPAIVVFTTFLALSPLLASDGHTNAPRVVRCYAPPGAWGGWVRAGSHLGAVTFDIDAKPVGSTVVVGEVRYWTTEDRQEVRPFVGTVRIRTAPVIGNVEIRFKAVGTGTAVEARVAP